MTRNLKLYGYVYYNYKPVLSPNSSAFWILYILRPATSYMYASSASMICPFYLHKMFLFWNFVVISLLLYAAGLRATMRYMGVKR
jgi:hypothetical protein